MFLCQRSHINMVNLIVKYPGAISDNVRKYPDYNAAESFIEDKCERLANFGWQLTEFRGSNSKQGKIECVMYREKIVIEWETK